MRQFKDTSSVGYIPMDPKEFTSKINEAYLESVSDPKGIWEKDYTLSKLSSSNLEDQGYKISLKPGYADFCKHLFIPNFTDATLYYAPINPSTVSLIESDYVARKEYELPVLRRWKWLDS